MKKNMAHYLCGVCEKSIDDSKYHQSFVTFASFGFIRNAVTWIFLTSNIFKDVLNHAFVLNASVICLLSVHLTIKIPVHLFLTIRKIMRILVAAP